MSLVDRYVIANISLAGLQGIGVLVSIGLTILKFAMMPELLEEMGEDPYSQGYQTGYMVGAFLPPIFGGIYTILYGITAYGLKQRAQWGYILHLISAALTAVSCCACCLGIFGFIYTIIAYIHALKPEFKAEFQTA